MCLCWDPLTSENTWFQLSFFPSSPVPLGFTWVIMSNTLLCTSLKFRTYDPQFKHLHTSGIPPTPTQKVFSLWGPSRQKVGFSCCYLLRCVFLLQECVNPCCNATTCTLMGDAVCAHGQCCDDCKVRGYIQARFRPISLFLPDLNNLITRQRDEDTFPLLHHDVEIIIIIKSDMQH